MDDLLKRIADIVDDQDYDNEIEERQKQSLQNEATIIENQQLMKAGQVEIKSAVENIDVGKKYSNHVDYTVENIGATISDSQINYQVSPYNNGSGYYHSNLNSGSNKLAIDHTAQSFSIEVEDSNDPFVYQTDPILLKSGVSMTGPMNPPVAHNLDPEYTCNVLYCQLEAHYNYRQYYNDCTLNERWYVDYIDKNEVAHSELLGVTRYRQVQISTNPSSYEYYTEIVVNNVSYQSTHGTSYSWSGSIVKNIKITIPAGATFVAIRAVSNN